MDKDKKIFSENLKIYMERQDKKQSDLVIDLGFDKSTVSTWVNGKKIPRPDTLRRLASYFGVYTSDLLNDKKENISYVLDKANDPNLALMVSEAEAYYNGRLVDEFAHKYKQLDNADRMLIDSLIDRLQKE